MTLLRIVGIAVLVLACIFVAFAAIGIEAPGLFAHAPNWLRAALIIGACIYLALGFLVDFSAVRDWFRRGGPPR